jgi:septin 6/8/11
LVSFDSTPESHKETCVRLKAHTYELQESSVNLKLTLVDTVGYVSTTVIFKTLDFVV